MWGYLLLITLFFSGAVWVKKHWDTREKEANILREELSALEERERISSGLFESAPFGIFRTTSDGVLLEVNDSIITMFGYESADKMITKINKRGITDALYETPEDREALIEGLKHQQGWIDWEGPLRHKDGHLIIVKLRLKKTLSLAGNFIVEGFVEDVTGLRNKEKALKQNEAYYRTLFESAGDAIFLFKDTVFVDCNAQTLKMFCCERDQIIGKSPVLFAPEKQPDGSMSADKSAIKIKSALSGTKEVFDWQHKRYNGELFDAEVMLNRISSPDGDCLLAIVRDITERRAFEDELELARKVFDNAVEGVVVTDAEGRIDFVNPSFEEITGYSAEEALGQNPRILKSDRHGPQFYKEMWASLTEQGYWCGEIWNRRKNGEAYPEWLAISAIKNSLGKTVRYMSIFHDLTETKRKENLLNFQSNHDALTGLPNRSLFIDRLKEAVSQAERNGWGVTLLFLGLDNFKKINDTMGHINGDMLLQMVSMRLQSCSRDEDTVARLGGDEFVYLMLRSDNPQNTLQVIHRIQQAMSEPFQLEHKEFNVNMSIGISTYPGDGKDSEALLGNADIALCQAKQQGRNTYRYFTPKMNEHMTRLVELEGKLHKALGRDEIKVYYQPKIDVETGKATGMEALVRWVIPNEGIISPAEFIPMAEDTGLIVSIGAWVLEEACRQTKLWRGKGASGLRVAVNLSPRQFREKDLVDTISSALERNGLPAEALELEVTESTLIHETETVQRMLSELKEIGVSVALDDFGTGYSSLSYLRRFPIDVLKIDKSFVDDIPKDSEANTLVTTILAMAKGLNIQVVAEGVETVEQFEFLRDNLCDFIQGYYFNRPLSPEDFEKEYILS